MQLLTSLDVGAKFDSQLKEFTYDVRGKKTLPVTDNGLLSVDLKGGYNYNPGTRKVGGLHLFVFDSFCVYKISYDLELLCRTKTLCYGSAAFDSHRTHDHQESLLRMVELGTLLRNERHNFVMSI